VDFPLAVIYATAIGYLLLFARIGSDSAFRIYAVALAILPWFKREGVILWGIAAVCGIVLRWRDKERLRYAIALLPGLVLVIGWRGYLSLRNTLPSHDFASLTELGLANVVARLGPIAREVAFELIRIREWLVFWLVAIGSSIYLLRSQLRREGCLLLATTVAPLLVYGATYSLSAWPDFAAHLRTSFPRLVMQLVPLALISIGLAAAHSTAPAPSSKVNRPE
jgi:hypothetical protein